LEGRGGVWAGDLKERTGWGEGQATSASCL